MTLFSNTYPYLIAGLPDLVFETEQKSFRLESIREEVLEQLKPADLDYVKTIYYYYDNINLVSILGKSSLPFIPLGIFTLEELQEEVIEPVRMPAYMAHFTDTFRGRNDEEVIEESRANHVLMEAYYEYASKSSNEFIRKWSDFERTLQNIKTAYLSRKANKSPEGQFLGNSEEVEIILKNFTTGDFGIKLFVDFADRLFQIFDMDDLYEREQKLDLLRWETADNLVLLKTFEVDVVLSYLVKANMLGRWSRLDLEKGSALFKQTIENLRNVNLFQNLP